VTRTALCSFDKPDYKQKHHRADGSIDDCGKDSTANLDVKEAEEPTADERPDHADDEVADETKAITLDDLACEPPSD